MAVQTERRTQLRKRPLSLVYVELNSMNGGMMRDISEGGFALRVMIPLRPGAKTDFSFSLDPSTHIRGEAQVVWLEEEGRVAGLSFKNISQDSRKQIRDWLVKPDETPHEEAVPKPDQPSTLDELRRQARSLISHAIPPRQHKPHTPSSRAKKSEKARPAGPPVVPQSPPQTVDPAPNQPHASQVASAEPLHSRIDVPESRFAEAMPAERQPHPEMPFFGGSPVEPRTPVRSGPEHPRVTVFPTPPTPPLLPLPAAWQRPAPTLEPLPALEHGRNYGSGERFTLSRAIGLLLLVALAITGYVYRKEIGLTMIQFGQQISGAEGKMEAESRPSVPSQTAPSNSNSQSPANAGPPATTSPTSGPENPQDNTPGSEDQAHDNPVSTSPAESSPEVTTALPPPRSLTGPLSAPAESSVSTPAPSAEPGQLEYFQALQIMRGKYRSAYMRQAVRLLWTAVEKGNSDAEVTLAELYRLGDGVGRNCDQTRVLLTAAARKGNPEAARRLRLFAREACED